MSVSIWWIRRDLRLDDNAALQAARTGSDSLLPVFILDPHLLNLKAEKRQQFLFEGLRALDVALQRRGSRLVVRAGPPQEALARLVTETAATALFAEEDYSPYARQRDAAVAAELPLHLAPGLTVHHPQATRKSDGSPYTVFTPFSKAWKALPWPGAPAPLPPGPLPALPRVESLELPSSRPLALFPAGEQEAQRRLASFLSDGVYRYHLERDRLDLESTSLLSPYLRFGMLSIRRAVADLQTVMENEPDAEAHRGGETWLNELIWREFYQCILYFYPEVLQNAFNLRYRHIAWHQAPEALQAWQEGRTGYPVVDAAMRQLAHTGWMHNRARMITASFLAKDLLINWQAGERWFMQHLVDGDPAANNGGWQWTAGVGTDSAPYFRVFNPVLQGQKFDPQGSYVRQWLPELEQVPDDFIHQPWRMAAELQQRAGCIIAKDYPAPIVEHRLARQRALAAYQAAGAPTG